MAGLIRPYLILKKGGVRVGVMGINIQPRGLIAADHYKGMKYLDPVTSANEMAKRLRQEHRCDLVVCLSHLGYTADRELAAKTRGIDLILGGHSHTHMTEPAVVNDLDNNEVVIFQTSGRGVNVGRIDVHLAGKDGTGEQMKRKSKRLQRKINHDEKSCFTIPTRLAFSFCPSHPVLYEQGQGNHEPVGRLFATMTIEQKVDNSYAHRIVNDWESESRTTSESEGGWTSCFYRHRSRQR